MSNEPTIHKDPKCFAIVCRNCLFVSGYCTFGEVFKELIHSIAFPTMLSSSFARARKLSIIGVILVLLLFSCRKEVPDTSDIYLPEALKTAFYYSPGTYWIVEEKNTGLFFKDSLYLKSSRIDTVELLHPGSRLPFARKEVLKTRVAWPFYGIEFEIASESAALCSGKTVSGEPCHFVTLEYFSEGKPVGKTRMFYYPAIADQGWPVRLTGLIEPQVRIDTVFTSYSQAGIVFGDVSRVIIDSDRTFQGTSSVRYISPVAGIIRWQYPLFGTDWQTIRYRVVPGS